MTTRLPLATEEPTAEQAAALLTELAAAGTVARLDLLHAALRAAYRRGRESERRESERLVNEAAAGFAKEAATLAGQHAERFVAAVTARRADDAERDALPWCLRTGALAQA